MKIDENLIFDVGMHKGEDTRYYLRKGFNVVAFEADPELIELCKSEFSKEISEGRLTIVEGAIVDEDQLKNKTIKFYKNQNVSVWGTVVQDWDIRNKKFGTSSELIEVPTLDFRKCLEEYGIPYYLKIDIEGMDTICLNALVHFENKPSYVSIESDKVNFENLEHEFDIFNQLGYDSFQLINQLKITKQKEPKDSKEGKYVGYTFESGSSGLFGTDLRAKWVNRKSALSTYKWIFYGYKIWGDNSKVKRNLILKVFKKTIEKLTGSVIPGWYDTHARHSSIKENNHNKT